MVNETQSFNLNQNCKINFFTKKAYNLITSKRRYLNVFVVMSIFSVSLACFTKLLLKLYNSFSYAIKLNIALVDNYDIVSFDHVQFIWTIVWSEAIFSMLFLALLIFSGLIIIKIIKIYFTFYKRGISFY